MLTIREPIKLNIADDLPTVTDAFYERIHGNYSMMNASITPKELLFFLSTSPEIPDDLGGMTTVAVSNTMTDKRSISMDIINNVVNRILLSTTDNFTYQDQIYIDNILSKLGITDVAVFMKQVSNLSEEHKAVKELISLYSEELSLRGQAPIQRDETAKAGEAPHTREAEEVRPLPPIHLHSEIYKRLDTGAIYDIVNAFQSEQSHYYGTFHNNEIKTAEQLFVSKMLELNTLKARAVEGAPLTLQHFVNRFELGDILPPPQTEEAVLSQAAAASLLSTVEHALVEMLHAKTADSRIWLSLEQSLSETVENSISRYQSYHTEQPIFTSESFTETANTIEQYRGEARVLRELIGLRRRLGDLTVNMSTESNIFPDAPSMVLTQYNESLSELRARYGDSYVEQLLSETDGSVSEVLREKIILESNRELQSLIGTETALPGGLPSQVPPTMAHTVAPGAGELLSPEEALLIEKQKSMLHTKEIAEKTREILGRTQTTAKAKADKTPSAPSVDVPQGKTVREIELEYDIREKTGLLEQLVHRAYAEPSGDTSEELYATSNAQPQLPAVNKYLSQTLVTEDGKPAQNTYINAESRIVYAQPDKADDEESIPTAASGNPDAELYAPAKVQPQLPAINKYLSQTLFTESNRSVQSTYINSESQIVYPKPVEADGEVPFPATTSGNAATEPSAPQPPRPVSDLEADPELLAREIQEIDRRNREIFEAVKLSQIEKKVEQAPVPDRRKTLDMSLRALESPEAVMQELLNTPSSFVRPAGGLSPETEVYLQNADEQTRQIYQAIMRYEQNPQSAQQEKLLHVGSIGELNAAVSAYTQSPVSMTHVEKTELTREDTLQSEKYETVLEKFSELPARRSVVKDEPSAPPKVPIVHKYEKTDFSEELLEKLEQQRTRQTTTQVVSDEISNRQVQEITQNDISTQLVTQSSEDITKLVNQTIAKQMSAISDKVYQQMEKRLQTERNRRGRF